ncbi:uncharacterized protein E0L32_010636 [Thyridium curvatum]|uniref:Zn(2)-C6 fungal-type domain-containing protein n=1 Tax=Thyridium curvatum TaxID=1093900 RepID=A0A507ARZ3_9PEZI|nr:uncharacterized protein E0L32_010636 [Thyridium curvatum]TPX07638.1 hypothetical protein E0L32_010636 [Thyridium curvatum]
MASGQPQPPAAPGDSSSQRLSVPVSAAAHGPLPPHPPPPEPSVMKLTRGHSCVLCQQRKVRCDKNKPCGNCLKAGVDCRVIPPQPPRRRKKKPHERDLFDRLRKYETLLLQHGVQFEPIAAEYKTSDASTLDEVDELQHDLGGLKTSPSSSNDYPEGSAQDGRWYPYYKEYRATDQLLRDTSDDDSEGPTIHQAFDNMFENTDGFPFVIGGSTSKVTDLHPPGIQIFQLWQIYLTNVNPLLKITHAQTLQAQIIEAGANPSKISKPLECLMFAIYFIAITSMSDEDVMNTLTEEKSRVLKRFHHATQQSLINAGFMRSADMMTLQAFFLFLLSVRQYVDPRSLFCLIGIAVRIAQRIGLHRDGAQFNVPPFEAELRRRLWWQIAIFDKRIAEMTGSSITALSSSNSDTKYPLNVNDSDLYPHAKDPPAPYLVPTEMLFCLTRIEMTTAAAPGSVRPAPHLGQGRKVQYTSSPASPDVATHVANHVLPTATDLDTYCAGIENCYLKHCDPKIPLHLFTLLMTRQALCKLRVIAYLVRSTPGAGGPPNHGPDGAPVARPQAAPGPPNANTPPDEDGPGDRDALFLEAIRMIEYDNVLQSSEALRGFLWYTHMYFPLPGYMFLTRELRSPRRQQAGDELVERAWAVIAENHERRGLARKLKSPVHLTFGSMFIKAWDAREAAEAAQGRALETPKFIELLRERFAKLKPKQTQAQQQQQAQQHQQGGPHAGMPVEGSLPGGMQPIRGVGVTASPAAQGAYLGDDSMPMFPTFDLQGYGMGNDMFGGMDWSFMVPEAPVYGGAAGAGGGMMYDMAPGMRSAGGGMQPPQ